jgi:hypothetical protein
MNLYEKFLLKYQKEGLRKALHTTLIYFKNISSHSIDEYQSPKNLDIREDVAKKYNFSGELLDIFLANRGNVVHKWHHYIPLYDKYFSDYRNRQIRFLEIGVSKGGSLQMWRKYFGEDAIIFGIDIDPECKKYNGLSAQVRIGSQADEKFLSSVVAEMGGIDIVLDDGSHEMDHIVASLRLLFPKLNDQGVYLIEDLHTAYWPSFGGGFCKKSNFFNKIRDLIDDMHQWYHHRDFKEKLISDSCSAIHIHDSIVVLEKNKVYRPVHSKVF